jgi:hypothetical protein
MKVDLDEQILSSLYDLKASNRKCKASSTKKYNQKLRKKVKVLKSPCFSINNMFTNREVSVNWIDPKLDFVAISKIGRRDSASLLDSLSSGIDFAWILHPPRGRSRGLLLGVRSDTYDILASLDEDFHIEFHIRNKADNFTRILVAVYGAVHEEFKAKKIVNLAKYNSYLNCIEGDFNLLKFPHKRSKGRFNNY